MPQPAVRASDGRRYRLDDALGGGFVLLGAGVDPRARLSATERAWCRAIGMRHAVMYPLGDRPYGAKVERSWPKDLVELEDISGDSLEASANASSSGGDSFELRFESLSGAQRSCSFPCDAAGNVDLDALSERERNRYLYARAVMGREFSMPRKYLAQQISDMPHSPVH